MDRMDIGGIIDGHVFAFLCIFVHFCMGTFLFHFCCFGWHFVRDKTAAAAGQDWAGRRTGGQPLLKHCCTMCVGRHFPFTYMGRRIAGMSLNLSCCLWRARHFISVFLPLPYSYPSPLSTTTCLPALLPLSACFCFPPWPLLPCLVVETTTCNRHQASTNFLYLFPLRTSRHARTL